MDRMSGPNQRTGRARPTRDRAALSGSGMAGPIGASKSRTVGRATAATPGRKAAAGPITRGRRGTA